MVQSIAGITDALTRLVPTMAKTDWNPGNVYLVMRALRTAVDAATKEATSGHAITMTKRPNTPSAVTSGD